tara:strand:- start:3842 stop:5632 length:1791 start_codon:yes stop_codon:yes gene_type:complete
MYRLIKLISLVILIMMPSTDSYADEVLWGTSTDADADPSSFSPFDYGAVGNGIADDSAAVQLAATAACTYGSDAILDMTRANGSAVQYRFGSATNNSFFTSGVRFLSEVCTNAVTITGDCNDRTNVKVLTGGNNGQALFSTCKQDDAISTTCEDDATSVTSQAYTFQCMTIEDDDPILHGGQNSATYQLASAPVPTPVYEEVVTYTGGSGVVVEWDASRLLLVVGSSEPDDLPTTVVALTGASFGTVTPSSVAREKSVEGTHGVYLKPCDNCRVERNNFIGLSDEGVDMHAKSDNVTIIQNNCTGISSSGEGGSCINFDGTSGGFLAENTCEGGKGSAGLATGSCYTIATNAATITDDLRFANNTCVEDGTGENAIETCIVIAALGSNMTNIVLSDITLTTTASGNTEAIVINNGATYTSQVDIYDLTHTGGGRIFDEDSFQNDNQVTLWNPTIDYTGTIHLNAVAGLNIYGGTISKGGGSGSTVTLIGDYPHTIQGVNFLDCANSCIYLSSSSNKVIGNTFTSVGDGGGNDYSVRELAPGNNNVVNENQTLEITGAAALTPYAVGPTPAVSGGNCIAGPASGTGSYCDGTRNTRP